MPLDVVVTRTSPGAATIAARHPADGITVGLTGITGAVALASSGVVAGLGTVVVVVLVVVLVRVEEMAVEALLVPVHDVRARAPRVVARSG